MPTPIPEAQINFAVGGLADVERAFTSLEQRLARVEANSLREQERAAKARVRNAKSEVDEREKAYAKLEKEAARWEKEATREADKEARERARISARETADAAREARRMADEKIREQRRVERESERINQKMARLQQQVADDEERQAARRHRALGRVEGRVANNVIGGIASVGRYALGAAGISGGFLLADAARNATRASETASLIRNVVTVGNNNVAPAEASVANIVGSASQASRATGMDRDEILSGALEYARKAKGGDIKGALGNMQFFAKMAKVTGASISDIAGAAGTLQSQNQNLGVPQMQQMLLDVFAQSGKGSLGMVDIAKQLGVMASARGAFAGDVATNQRKLLALGQLAAPEGSPEEAGTFVKDLVMEAGKHRKSTRDSVGLEQMGVKFDKFGRMESPEQMIEAVFRGTGGDITKIEKLFGARGKAVFGALLNPFTQAGGGEKGIAAVRSTLDNITGAGMKSEDLDKRVAEMMEEPGEKFKNALNQMSLELEGKVTPLLPKLAADFIKMMPAVERLTAVMADFAGWLANSPIMTLLTGGDADKKNAGAIADSNNAVNDAGAVKAKATGGRVTAADVDRLMKEKGVLEGKLKEEKDEAGGWGWSWMTGFAGSGDRKAAAAGEAKNTQMALDSVNEALKLAAESIKKSARDIGNAGNTAPNNPANHLPIDVRPTY